VLLQRIVVAYCRVLLQRIAAFCSVLRRVAFAACCGVLRNTLQSLQRAATHRNTLQHTAAHRNTPQHTATRCSTLTATHCNTLQHTGVAKAVGFEKNTPVTELQIETEVQNCLALGGVSVTQFHEYLAGVLQCVAMCCSVLQRVVVHCSVCLTGRRERDAFS